MVNWDPKSAWRKYQVEAKDCHDFIARYYKPERSTERGPACVARLVSSRESDLKEYGVTIISHHDSTTGQIVAYYGPEEVK